MSTDRDTKHIVRSWLRAGEDESADRVLDTVLDRLDTIPQRRATSWPARRFPEMNNSAKVGLGAAAVVVAAFLGLRFLVPGDLSVGGDPDPAASPSPTSTSHEIPFGDRPLEAGRYSLRSGFPAGITFEVPAGWTSCIIGPLEQGVCRNLGTMERPTGVGVAFLVIENVVADPCDEASLLDPPVGPSIDELATAMTNLQGFTVSAVDDTTIDGFPAKRLTVIAPETPVCEAMQTWATPSRLNGVGAGEANLTYLVDVDGVRIMINLAYFPPFVSDAEMDAAEEIISSIQIEP